MPEVVWGLTQTHLCGFCTCQYKGRAELALKTAKRLLRDNMSPTRLLDNVAVTRAVLTYRNTLGRDIGL